jgi:hypothetical protein
LSGGLFRHQRLAQLRPRRHVDLPYALACDAATRATLAKRPGTAKGPGPMAVPPGQLGTYLGIAKVSLVASNAPLAIVDTPLMG